MFTNRISKFAVLLGILVIMLVSVSFAAFPKADETYQDYGLRHRGDARVVVASAVDNKGSDYFQRHAAELSAATQLDTTEYFLRHNDLKATSLVDSTDYFFRQLAE